MLFFALNVPCSIILKGLGDNAIANVESTIEIMKARPFQLMLGACSWMENTCRLDIAYGTCCSAVSSKPRSQKLDITN